MIKSFKCGDTTSCAEKETLDYLEQMLRLHSLETSDLIHQYYFERLKQQNGMSDPSFGKLTVRCGFADDNYLDVSYSLNHKSIYYIFYSK